MSSLHRLRGKEDGIVCRLCSSNNGIMVLNIFDSEGQKRRVLSLIKDCLPVQVSETDALPKVICHNCLHKLESFHEFQTNCLKSEATLMSSVSYSTPRASNTYLQEFNNIPHPNEESIGPTTKADFSAELVPLDRLTQLIHPAPLLDQVPVHHEHQRENSLEMMVKQEIEETKSPENEEDAEWDESYIEEDLSLETGHDSDTTEQFECVEMKTEKNSSVEASVTSEMHTDQTLDDTKRARHKREAIKEARLSGNKYVNYKGKEIPAKSCGEPCGCHKNCFDFFSDEDRAQIFNHFYSFKNKDAQDTYLQSLINMQDIKQRRSRNNYETRKPRACSFVYHILKGRERVTVCKKALVNLLNVSPNRLRRLAILLAEGKLPKDLRGQTRHNCQNLRIFKT